MMAEQIQSLEVSFQDLVEFSTQLSVFLLEEPRQILEIFNMALMTRALHLNSNFQMIFKEVYVRITRFAIPRAC